MLNYNITISDESGVVVGTASGQFTPVESTPTPVDPGAAWMADINEMTERYGIPTDHGSNTVDFIKGLPADTLYPLSKELVYLIEKHHVLEGFDVTAEINTIAGMQGDEQALEDNFLSIVGRLSAGSPDEE